EDGIRDDLVTGVQTCALPIFIGTETGVSFSRDDGRTWLRLKLNLPTVAVSDLVIKDNDLVVGTSGRSIWILDDVTPIREWNPERSEERRVGERVITRWSRSGA